MLTQVQRKDFERNGFLILPNFVAEESCDRLISEANQLVRDFQPDELKTVFSTVDQQRVSNDYFMSSGDQIRFFFEPGAFTESGELKQPKELSINKIGHALHDLNPTFFEFSRQAKLASICMDLGFEMPLLMQSMYIFKQPRIGGEVTCHQDGTFLFTEPMSVVGFWFALEDATISNGCMYALPGGHQGKLKRRFRRDKERGVVFDELDSSPWPSDGYIPLEVPKGSLILLHGLLPHLSGANTSDISRHAYTIHMIEGNAHYPQDNWLQRGSQNPARGF